MAVRIELLGAVTVTADDDGPWYLESAQARVAFARLTVGRREGVTRHELADVVWPEELPPTWASALRSLVSRVRVFLRPVVPEGTDPVVARGGRYFLVLDDDVEVDIERAERAIVRAHDRLALGDFAAARQDGLDGAAQLRSPFLPDGDGPWVTRTREHLAELFVTGLEITSRASAALGEHTHALLRAREAMSAQPLRESAHRCLMAAHAAVGNRGEALLVYQRLRRLLAEELGVDPSSATEAAYLDLLGPALVPAHDDPGRADGANRPRADAPFVDRRVEMTTALDGWSRAMHGHRQLLYLTGEEGIGKTRFAQEVGRRIGEAGGLVLVGRCDPGSTVTYQPIVEAVTGYLTGTTADDLPALGPRSRAVLAKVLPIEGTLPARDLPDGAEVASAVVELVVAATRTRPVALLLDDLQWADDDLLLLLARVLRHTADARLFVLAVVRGGPAIALPLREDLRRLEHAGGLTRLPLGGLNLSAIEELCRALLPTSPPGELARSLHAETAGNPYMLLEILQQLMTTGEPPGDLPVPQGIVDLVDIKLARLDQTARQLIRAAALCQSEFHFGVTAQAAGIDEARALDALDLAMDAGLVVETGSAVVLGNQPPLYRFRHGVIRRVVHGGLSVARRQYLHDRLAAASAGAH